MGIREFFGGLHFKRKAAMDVHPVPDGQKPVLHRSICTGETTAGFKDSATGKYMEVMLVRDDADLKKFMKEYGITQKPETEY